METAGEIGLDGELLLAYRSGTEIRMFPGSFGTTHVQVAFQVNPTSGAPKHKGVKGKSVTRGGYYVIHWGECLVLLTNNTEKEKICQR